MNDNQSNVNSKRPIARIVAGLLGLTYSVGFLTFFAWNFSELTKFFNHTISTVIIMVVGKF